MKEPFARIDFIDYARGVAIISVFLYHAVLCSYGFGMLPWQWLTRGFSGVPASFIALLPLHFGFMGVPLFFVISGFCIHLSFEKQGQEWKSFFVRRFFRIYPAYFAALLTFSFLYAQNGPDFWFQFKYHALLLHNYNPGTYNGLNGSFGSIAIEAQLYLLYPLLLVLVGKFGWKRTLICLAAGEMFLQSWESIWQAVASFTGALPAFFHNKYYILVSHKLTVCPLSFWFSWSIGACVADAVLKNQPMPFARSSVFFWTFMVIVSYFAAFLSPFFFMFSAILAAKVLGKHFSGESSNVTIPGFWLELLRRAGVYSYSIYLFHQPLLELLNKLLEHLFPGIDSFLKFLCCVLFWLVMMPLAGLSYRFIERPGIALGKWTIQKWISPGSGRSPTG